MTDGQYHGLGRDFRFEPLFGVALVLEDGRHRVGRMTERTFVVGAAGFP